MGLITGAVGVIMALVLSVEKLCYGMSLSNRPALLLAVLLILVGGQFITLGLLAELQARHYEAQRKPIYAIRRVTRGGDAGEGDAQAESAPLPPALPSALGSPTADLTPPWACGYDPGRSAPPFGIDAVPRRGRNPTTGASRAAAGRMLPSLPPSDHERASAPCSRDRRAVE